MSDDWLEISDDAIDVGEIKQRIHERIARRTSASPSEEAESPAAIAEALRQKMIEDTVGGLASSKHLPIQQRDCDVVPRGYVIDWRTPILGPIHALVRRIINAEIRRYLLPSLEKQSHVNRQMLRVLEGLVEENGRLRRQIEALCEEP
jgi:hypothetical protein